MFNLTLIYTLRFFKAGKEMFHYNEKDRYRLANCERELAGSPAEIIREEFHMKQV